MPTRNSEVLEDFVAFCKDNPELRFWQALKVWSGYNYVYVSNSGDNLGRIGDTTDTFYWEGKNRGEKP